jgi:hypothetical protein
VVDIYLLRFPEIRSFGPTDQVAGIPHLSPIAQSVGVADQIRFDLQLRPGHFSLAYGSKAL